MIIEYDIPEVRELTTALSVYWGRYLFVGSPSQNYQINTLASSYMRLTESAIIEYKLGSTALREFWDDHTSIPFGKMRKSISHFECCVTNMHRAIWTYKRLRNHKGRDPLSIYLANVRPNFVSDKIADPIRDIRNAIHHLDEMIVDLQIIEGGPLALKAEGTERPHPVEPNQTIKTIDHLEIGHYTLAFTNIATCLGEMAVVADKIALYEPQTVEAP